MHMWARTRKDNYADKGVWHVTTFAYILPHFNFKQKICENDLMILTNAT